jgi:glycosyltransferase involved in cell wall biosynthesis
VLVVAEAANPEWTSVPLVGWSLARALTDVADVHLVTHVRNRDAILRAGLAEEEFTAVDSEAVARPLWRLSNLLRGDTRKSWTTATAFSALAYYYFEHRLWKELGARVEAGAFDIVHRVTPLTPSAPSRIARKCRRAGVPFVWGPINGGVPWPPGFGGVRRREREWLSYVREAHRLLPGYTATRAYAAAILVASSATWEQMPARFHSKCVYLPENAVEPARFGAEVRPREEGPLRLAFVGRLVPYKGADMLIEAAAPLVRAGRAVLDIYGDGPEMARLSALVRAEGLEAGARLHGWIEHSRLQTHLVRADVFAFPSIREFGGGVVLEAMALGLVPVVVDYAGPAELVTDATGFRVALGSRAGIVSGFRVVLERLAADPAQLQALARRGRERVLRWFTWREKAKQVLEVYRWVLGQQTRKPDFGRPLPD